MSLKEDIVVVNEYTVKTKSGGTRGATPGKYVTRYMAREAAVEPLLFSVGDGYIMKYMSRPGAVEHIDDPEKDSAFMTDSCDSVAFGDGDISLSADELKARSDEIQKCFDEGKTVFKTVFSFTDEYLHRTGITSDDFEFKSKGDYAGNIDQVKLRRGIMAAMDAIGKYHDNLTYVGVIQVDTSHVHCHICAVDKGTGNVIEKGKFKGQQKGNLTAKEVAAGRRAMDNVLSPHKNLKKLYVKKDELAKELKDIAKIEKIMYSQDMQMLIDVLPGNTKMWRAKSNAKDMRRPNQILRNYVKNALDKSQVHDDFKSDMHEIAMARKNREGLTDRETQAIEDTAEKELEDYIMNSVYRSLKKKKPKKNTSTDYLHAAKDNAKKEHTTEDSYISTIRTYNMLHEQHAKQEAYWGAMVGALDTSHMNEGGRDFFEFAQNEYAYQKMLHEKYAYVLTFLRTGEIDPEQTDKFYSTLSELDRCEKMMNDDALHDPDMTEPQKEAYGMNVYGIKGGRAVGHEGTGPLSEKAMHDAYEEALAKQKAEVDDYLHQFNLHMEPDGEMKPNMSEEHFRDIDPADLHRMKSDKKVRPEAWERFCDIAKKRVDLFKKAIDYLKKTGQDKAVDMPTEDVEKMEDVMTSHDTKPKEDTKEKAAEEEQQADSVNFDYAPMPDDEQIHESTDVVKDNIVKSDTHTILSYNTSPDVPDEYEDDDEI